MTVTGSPRLWLRCGSCNGANLATLSLETKPLEGEDFGVQSRPDGRWEARPAWDRPGWTHEFHCKRCSATHRIRGERLTSWWTEFTATGKRRDVRYIGRDR